MTRWVETLRFVRNWVLKTLHFVGKGLDFGVGTEVKYAKNMGDNMLKRKIYDKLLEWEKALFLFSSFA